MHSKIGTKVRLSLGMYVTSKTGKVYREGIIMNREGEYYTIRIPGMKTVHQPDGIDVERYLCEFEEI